MKERGKGIPEYMFELNERRLKYGAKFQRTFGTPLQRFWDITTGFDVVKFDDWLKTPDGFSTAQHVENKYGKDAVDLCRALFSPLATLNQK